MTAPSDSFQISVGVDEAREDYVTTKLIEYNEPYASPLWKNRPRDPEPLHVYALDEHGTIIGGVIGKTHGVPEWVTIDIVWVDEALRGRGIGTQLMLRAEAEARARGCRFAKLSTAQFQAPEFYPKIGYRLYGTLEDFPRGENDYMFTKDLGVSE